MSNLTLELDAEVKEKILQKAITHVLHGWDRGQTPLENALRDAILKVAREEVEILVKDDPVFSEKMKVLLRSTPDKVFSQDQDKFSERIVDAFV